MLGFDMNQLNAYLGSSINAPKFIPFCRESESTPGCHYVEDAEGNAIVQSRTRFYNQTVLQQGRVYLKWIGHSLQEEQQPFELTPRFAIIYTNKTDEQMYVVLSFEIYLLITQVIMQRWLVLQGGDQPHELPPRATARRRV